MTGKFSVGEYTIGRVSKQKVLPVSVPITGDNGTVIGVVAGSLDLKWLDSEIRARDFALDSNLTITDRNAVVLGRYPDAERYIGTAIPKDYQYIVREEYPGTVELTSPDGKRRLIAYYPPSTKQPGVFVATGVSTAAEYAAVTSAIYSAAGGALITAALALLAASLTGRYSIKRPVAHMVRTVEAWRNRDEHARTGMSPTNGEFGQLGAAIDTYMDELVAARQLRRQDEERREVLMQELHHRVKNLLSTVQAVARQSFRSAVLDPAIMDTFTKRLVAMGEAHALLMKDGWESATLRDIVKTAIRPFDKGESSHFRVDGPDFVVNSRASLALGMALHELCTNAVKYGALKCDEGVVDIDWELSGGPGPELTLKWVEKGGPPVKASEKSGFGSTMIQRMLGGQINGEVDVTYDVSGLQFCLRVLATHVEHVSRSEA